MYKKTEFRKIKNRKTDVQTYMHIFVQTYIYRHRDTQKYRWTDKQADRQTDTAHRGRHPDSRQTGGQNCRQKNRRTERRTARQTDFEIFANTYFSAAFYAGKQAAGG